jgi:hypothetical protein
MEILTHGDHIDGKTLRRGRSNQGSDYLPVSGHSRYASERTSHCRIVVISG